MKGQQRMQWSFSDKASPNVPQLLSFMSAGDKQTGKLSSHDRMMSSSLQGTGATTCQNRYNHHQSKETRILPPVHNDNGKMYISMSSCSSPHHHKYSLPFPAGQDTVTDPTSSAQFVDGVPTVVTVITPTLSPSSSMVGTTDLRNSGPWSPPPISSAPAQLTIFYDGSVCVYDDVTPKKARAIMLLAGDEPSRNNNVAVPAAPSPISWAPPREGYLGDKLINAISAVSSAPSPISLAPATATAGAASSALVSGVAVPQARKASLARFLEKRKERASSTSPYGTTPEKNYPERIIIS